MIVLYFLFLVKRYTASVSTSLNLHMPTSHWNCLESSSLPWFNVYLVFYLETCLKSVGFSNSSYTGKFSKWPVAFCSNSGITWTGFQYADFTARVATCRITSLSILLALLYNYFFWYRFVLYWKFLFLFDLIC